jgi:hypothetical protein
LTEIEADVNDLLDVEKETEEVEEQKEIKKPAPKKKKSERSGGYWF